MYLAGGNYDAYTNPQSSFGRGRNPISGGQFGQTQIGQVSGPSLEEVLSQRGFKVPEKPTGVMHQAMVMYKDPITGKMQSGGAHGASHANAMSKFYEQNPEALDIAKQHQKGQQFQGSGPTTSIGDSLRPPQEIMPQPIRDRRARMDIHLAPPTRPSMGNPSGSLGGQIIAGQLQRGDFGMGIKAPPSSRPNPYSAPPQIGGGFGGQMGGQGMGQGMGQFMQFMQTMMQMFQQFQGGGGRGMGGGFGGPSPFMPQQQQYGQYQPQQQISTRGPASMMQTQRMSNQFNPNNAFGGY